MSVTTIPSSNNSLALTPTPNPLSTTDASPSEMQALIQSQQEANNKIVQLADKMMAQMSKKPESKWPATRVAKYCVGTTALVAFAHPQLREFVQKIPGIVVTLLHGKDAIPSAAAAANDVVDAAQLGSFAAGTAVAAIRGGLSTIVPTPEMPKSPVEFSALGVTWAATAAVTGMAVNAFNTIVRNVPGRGNQSPLGLKTFLTLTGIQAAAPGQLFAIPGALAGKTVELVSKGASVAGSAAKKAASEAKEVASGVASSVKTAASSAASRISETTSYRWAASTALSGIATTAINMMARRIAMPSPLGLKTFAALTVGTEYLMPGASTLKGAALDLASTISEKAPVYTTDALLGTAKFVGKARSAVSSGASTISETASGAWTLGTDAASATWTKASDVASTAWTLGSDAASATGAIVSDVASATGTKLSSAASRTYSAVASIPKNVSEMSTTTKVATAVTGTLFTVLAMAARRILVRL